MATVRSWQVHKRIRNTLESLAWDVNPVLRGWITYYEQFTRAALSKLFCRLEARLAQWARWKYKRMRRNRTNSWEFIRAMHVRLPGLFEHWRIMCPPRDGSMTRAV
ncbi:group II intron maturase-specific domain-containing protein [Castellaniella caeni]